jgi:hypothetical protein
MCAQASTHDTTRPERRHDAASGKRVARTCRRHTGGHALTFFARPHVPEHPRTTWHDPTRLDSPERVCTSTHTRHDPTHPNRIWGLHVCTTRTKFGVSMGARPERRPDGASGKRAARMCSRHTGGDDLFSYIYIYLFIFFNKYKYQKYVYEDRTQLHFLRHPLSLGWYSYIITRCLAIFQS